MAARNLTPKLSRREAVGLGAVAAGGVAIGLAGCSAADTAQPSTPNSSGAEIAATSDIPVGGGANFDVDNVKMVVTQPTEGEFKAFSAVCTHQGCIVGTRDAEIVCDCHDSLFKLEDGAVISGPATSDLPEIAITVKDGKIFTA
jgi:nitrite reductase/ring-hydroxylating ferredoxin subunit